VRRDVAFLAAPDIFVTAQSFDGAEGTMERVLVNTYSAGKVATEINSARAVWDSAGASWKFLDGFLIEYGSGSGTRPRTSAFKTYSGALRSPPETIILERLVPDGVSIAYLAGRISRLEAVGAPVIEEKVQLYSKLAGPLANIVLALTGLTLVLLVRMNRIFGFGVALATGFSFWVFMVLGQSAGEAEMVPPAVAGFGPAIVFLTAALLGMRKARVF
jgi:lipopolysaccharide export system permease protein